MVRLWSLCLSLGVGLCLLLLGENSGVLAITNVDDDSDSDQNCLPRLADSCFTDIARNLECHLHPSRPYNCIRRDAEELCSDIQEGLTCASDIIDTDCSVEEGRERFDAWLRGLRAVYTSLCGPNNYQLQNLVNDPKCWNSLAFLNCVEQDVGVSHVVDLLKNPLDVVVCNHLLMAMTTCNVLATQHEQECVFSQDIIREVLHTFFSQSACGAACLRVLAPASTAAASVPFAAPHWLLQTLASCSALLIHHITQGSEE